MSLNLGIFDFASAPRTGIGWFSRAMEFANMGKMLVPLVYERFPERKENDKPRVTMVRHPWNWICCYYELGAAPGFVPELEKIDRRHQSFQDFVREYLARVPGAIGRLFASYEVDIVMRFEDQPAALVQLCVSLGMERYRFELEFFDRLPKVRDVRSEYQQQTTLRRMVKDAELETFDRYDYF